jgi:ribosome-binding protein aMBF1 (putative translation factor)
LTPPPPPRKIGATEGEAMRRRANGTRAGKKFKKEIAAELGRRLESFRDARGISLATLATLASLPLSTIAPILRGEVSCSLANSYRLAAVCGVSLDDVGAAAAAAAAFGGARKSRLDGRNAKA